MSSLSSLNCVFIAVVFIFSAVGNASEQISVPPGCTAAGDIIIGGLFPIHQAVDEEEESFAPHLHSCVRLQVNSLSRCLAMINAIEEMNKSPLLLDLNITLGYHIQDSCADVSMALRAVADFTQPAHCHMAGRTSRCDQPVTAVIGASHSEISISVARQLTLRMIPQISYSSTAVILSDKERFPAFMRTVPNDQYQTAAMVRLLSSYGWNWVGIITSDGDYGRSALDNFVSQASEEGICVAFKSILPQSVTSQDLSAAITQAAKTIVTNPKVQVIVSFAMQSHMANLYLELQSQMLTKGKNFTSMRRVWVASDSWSLSSSAHGNVTLHDIGHVLGFTFKSGSLSSLNGYLSRLEAAGLDGAENNPFLQDFYTQLNESGSSGGPELVSTAVQMLREHSSTASTFSIEMAVSAIAQAVASVCRGRDCKTLGALQPWEVLKALWMQEFKLQQKSYKFDTSGDINLGYDVIMWQPREGNINVHNVVAEYHPHSNSFTITKSKQLQDLRHISSRCSNSCVPGEFKKTAEGQHTCCYACINCTENYYSNGTDMDECMSCDTNIEWSPGGSSSCLPKDLDFFSWQDGFAVALLTFSALGILLALLVSALFLHQHDTPVVKAAGGPLSQVILFSLVVSYISTMLFVGQPNILQCKARQVLFGISFTLCVSCILVKSLKILLAFQFNPALQDVLRNIYKPYLIVIFCVALQASICIAWLVLKSPFNDTERGRTFLLEYCHEGSYVAFGVMLGYIAVLAFLCFACAFKGRKLPQQYNETRFITFSMLLYLISWLIFIPVYITSSTKYLPAVEMVVILISNFGIFSCHFLPKCYIILFKKEQNTESAFRNKLYEYSNKTSHLVSVCGSSEKQTGSQECFTVPSPSSAAGDPVGAAGVTHCRGRDSFSSLHRGSVSRLRRSTSL
ncbi:G-protein coupled receptor family C group 6 member A [Aulostomus maculatus]